MNEYPEDWPAIALARKERAGWCCERCDHSHDTAAGYMLGVHHLDMDKANVAWWNLPALCQRCHLRIQGKVKIARVWMFEHSAWMKPYVAGFYADDIGAPLSEDDARQPGVADAIIQQWRER